MTDSTTTPVRVQATRCGHFYGRVDSAPPLPAEGVDELGPAGHHTRRTEFVRWPPLPARSYPPCERGLRIEYGEPWHGVPESSCNGPDEVTRLAADHDPLGPDQGRFERE